ncbi:hypothetical protein [Streptomyces bobili]
MKRPAHGWNFNSGIAGASGTTLEPVAARPLTNFLNAPASWSP